MLWNKVNDKYMRVEEIAVVIDESNIENNQEEYDVMIKLSLQK